MDVVSRAFMELDHDVDLVSGIQSGQLLGFQKADGSAIVPADNDDKVPRVPLFSPLEYCPPSKDDKPRPHVCRTCTRPFARLEHLKRHERSHTKEKPFGCPVCERCFARRDLLLRHKQKLHQTPAPTARLRHRRQSSNSAVIGAARVRKNSVVSGAPFVSDTAMRPRANTISHVDTAAAQILAATSTTSDNRTATHGHGRQLSLVDSGYGGMAAAMSHRGIHHHLPRLHTQGINNRDLDFGLRTAPSLPFHPSISLEDLFFSPGSTVDPNALHYHDSSSQVSPDSQSTSFPQAIHELASQTVDDAYDWLTGFDDQISITADSTIGQSTNLKYRPALDGSSSSSISTTSQGGMSDVMLDGSNRPVPPSSSGSMWPSSIFDSTQMLHGYGLDLISPISSSSAPEPISASSSVSPLSQQLPGSYFSTPPSTLHPMSSSALSNQSIEGSLNIDAGPKTPLSISSLGSDLLMAMRDHSASDSTVSSMSSSYYTYGPPSPKLDFRPSSSHSNPRMDWSDTFRLAQDRWEPIMEEEGSKRAVEGVSQRRLPPQTANQGFVVYSV